MLQVIYTKNIPTGTKWVDETILYQNKNVFKNKIERSGAKETLGLCLLLLQVQIVDAQTTCATFTSHNLRQI